MGYQDLTPQLRTRLSRMERAVGIFVIVATLLLAVGFGYYIYSTAQTKGWFKTSALYYTYVQNAAGLLPGNKVRLMGFDIGEITQVEAEAPDSEYNVFIQMRIFEPHYGYIWTEGSYAKVVSADFLGGRFIEITKGTAGKASVKEETKKTLFGQRKVITGIWDHQAGTYLAPSEKSVKNGHHLVVEESPAISERLDRVVTQAEKALPNFLSLTNQLNTVLGNTARITENANSVVQDLRPAVSNIVAITDRLKDPRGSLGEWLIPTNINTQLESTLASATTVFTNVSKTLTNVDNTLLVTSNTIKTADSTIASARTVVTNADEHLALLVMNLNASLENLANLTSNLNSQVQANSNIVSNVSSAIVHADEMVQGLKRHWLLRSAFKEKKTNAPPSKSSSTKKKNEWSPPKKY